MSRARAFLALAAVLGLGALPAPADPSCERPLGPDSPPNPARRLFGPPPREPDNHTCHCPDRCDVHADQRRARAEAKRARRAAKRGGR